jgi:anion exchange protein
MLTAINDFLDESVVLPPGDWASQNLLSISEIQEIRKKKKARKDALEEDKLNRKESEASIKRGEAPEPILKSQAPVYDPNDPLSRAPFFFGGMINDLKRRFPHYLSDITDGFNGQALAASIFIYFAALSGAIAFGGLLGEKTVGLIGITETLMTSSVGGVLFSLFSGMPLIITGVTGPVLLFDEALFKFSEEQHIDFLAWRIWIGIWLLIFAIVVAFFQGSVLVKYFTKFTKEIFASLVSLLFIFEAINKLAKIFQSHPLQAIEFHCNTTYENYFLAAIEAQASQSDLFLDGDFTPIGPEQQPMPDLESVINEPNTALLSAFLMLGCFGIAYFLRIFRNGHYLGRTVRRALGDFGVPIAIVIMVVIDMLITDTYTEKLNVPEGLKVTDPTKRGWLINPMGAGDNTVDIWVPFVSAVPAFLLYVLLFMETHICEFVYNFFIYKILSRRKSRRPNL